MNINSRVNDFVIYYLNLSVSPQYAVMLKGPWGCGKSHFIKGILNEVEKPQNLYVSLNGVSSKLEIEQEFYRQLHPVLSSKAARLTGRLLQGALKTTINVDWNGDTRPDASGQVGLPDIDFSKYLNGPQDVVLIFDDLERCRIAVPEVLGYINHFVEHEGCKVIILANEDEILQRKEELEDKTDEYGRIREKLIGKTLGLVADVNAAIQVFIKDMNNVWAQESVRENIDLIQSLFSASGYGNLRHLRQAILEFDNLVTSIRMRDPHKGMLKELLSTLLVLSLETRANQIKIDEVKTIDRAWLTAAFRDSDRIKKLTEIRTKYETFGAFDSILSKEIWGQIFQTGLIPGDDVNREILQSKYYSNEEERPVWLRLWEMFEHDDVSLRAAINEADKMLNNCSFESFGELLHVCGALMQLSEMEVYPGSVDKIVLNVKKNVDAMSNGGILVSQMKGEHFGYDSWAGRMYHKRESRGFRVIIDYIKESTNAALERSYPVAAMDLVELAKTDQYEFAEALFFRNGSVGKYYNVPILKYIDIQQFIEVLQGLNATRLKTIAHGLQNRYNNPPVLLKEEEDWLLRLKIHLTPLIEKRKGTMAGFWLRKISEEAMKAFVTEDTIE